MLNFFEGYESGVKFYDTPDLSLSEPCSGSLEIAGDGGKERALDSFKQKRSVITLNLIWSP